MRVHHSNATVVWIHCAKMLSISASVIKTIPTKLITANNASHVVASRVLLNLCLAYRTELNATLFFCPAFKLVFHCLLTWLPCMPFIFALEANLSRTYWAHNLLVIQRWTSHETFATRFGTPSHKWILVDSWILLERFVLLKNFWVIQEEVLNLSIWHFESAKCL